MGVRMRKHLKSLLTDERGSAAAEYALLLAIIGTSIALAASTLGGAISGAIATTVANF
jgi:pilus assembly protein Flp/PilA